MFPLLILSPHARTTTLLYIHSTRTTLSEITYDLLTSHELSFLSSLYGFDFDPCFIFSLTWFLHIVSQRIFALKFLFGFLLKIDTSFMHYIPNRVSPLSTPVRPPSLLFSRFIPHSVSSSGKNRAVWSIVLISVSVCIPFQLHLIMNIVGPILLSFRLIANSALIFFM